MSDLTLTLHIIRLLSSVNEDVVEDFVETLRREYGIGGHS